MQIDSRPLSRLAGVDVWFDSLDACDADYHHYWRLLSIQEQSAARRFIDDLHHRRYVVCHGKLRLLLSRYVHAAPEYLDFGRQAFGKPYLLDAAGKPASWQFNLSHSADRMLLAVGRVPMGIDLEVWNTGHDLAELATECLAPDELAYWQTLPFYQRIPAFYCFWTRKESLVKAVGIGMAVGIKDVVTTTFGVPDFAELPAECGATCEWRLFDLALSEGFSAALTVKNQL